MPTPQAVFFKNHRQYLEGAAERNAADPEALTTFRSNQEWTSAERLVTKYGPIPAYAAEIGVQGKFGFEARLEVVRLRPDESQPETTALLAHDLPATADEGVWKPGEGSLYAISHCRRIPPRPYSDLIKVADGKPLSSEYRYGYVIVEALPDAAPSGAQTAADVGQLPKPLRRANIVSRIVRDSALVRSLKALHADRCQICGIVLRAADGSRYSEGHHLRPLGGDHAGPDVAENIIIVCPNDHALLDLGWIRVDPATLSGTEIRQIGAEYVTYHNDVVAAGAVA